MTRRLLLLTCVGTGLLALAYLIWASIAAPPGLDQLLPGVFFWILIIFTDIFGVRLAGGAVSLLPMITAAACLVIGPVPAGWAAFAGSLVYAFIRYRWPERLGAYRESNRIALIGLTAVNASMHTASIVAGGLVFRALGGETPLQAVTVSQIPSLIGLGLTFLAANYLIAGLYIARRGQAMLRAYLRSLPNMLFYEGGPMLFAPLVALIYTQLGLIQFAVFALLLIITSLITRNLALTSQRLERRVKELGGLQAVGQALSASLNLDRILSAIYTQVAALMPARNFYVALYDPETDEVSFPLAMEDEKRVAWQSRQAGKGLTEHILQTRQPLLIPRDVNDTLRRIGLEQIGQPAASWLGVPILAEGEAIGIIAVQSYTTPRAYDESHQEVLVTIAAQAAVAIQNARLYERTDKALARRVQELNSILRTTREGIILLDLDWRIVAANRAMTSLLNIAQTELIGQRLDAQRQDQEPLITQIGFTSQDLILACQELVQDPNPRKHIIVSPGPPERHIERTLTPVHDQEGMISGWLLIFRDITEEVELARLRDDMSHMLVHDLRSPLTVLRGSLDMLDTTLGDEKTENTETLLEMAKRGSERMLRMVNELLDLSKIESGKLVVHPEPVEAAALLKDIAIRIRPLAVEAKIDVEISVAPDLPPLQIDADLIGRVLHNLVDNAIKFTPDNGRVRLWARLDPQNTPDAALIGVSDTGPGIPPEEQERLFEKFQQVSTVVGRRVGTGLGLPFCKLAVEAHGGRIWVESKVGEGSTFILQLPTAMSGTAT